MGRIEKGLKMFCSKTGQIHRKSCIIPRLFQKLIYFNLISTMEAKLENILDSMMQNDNAVGVLLSDSQGLSYGSEFPYLMHISG